MNPTDVLDAVVWVGSAGGVCALVVQLVKYAVGDAMTPRQRVVAATGTATLLTLAYALSNGMLTVQNVYGLLVAVPTIAATGSGLQSAITATATNRPQ